ncbi:hypothetical protein LPA04_08380 [Lacticaseibacillus paracasei subsp. paracasei]|nr:hypothetical protein LPA04_08380 [Lacticaseibacillus paracasei subsp. paracasei]
MVGSHDHSIEPSLIYTEKTCPASYVSLAITAATSADRAASNVLNRPPEPTRSVAWTAVGGVTGLVFVVVGDELVVGFVTGAVV